MTNSCLNLQSKSNEMKRLLVFLSVICLFVASVQAQTNVASKKFLTSGTVRSDTSFTIQSSDLLDNYTWQLWVNHTGSTLAGTPYVKLQVSPDGTNWLNYPDLDSVAVSAVTGNIAFEDAILPSNRIRVYFNMTAGDTLKAVNIWYTLKRQ